MADQDRSKEGEEPQPDTPSEGKATRVTKRSRLKRLFPFAGVGIVGGLILGGAINAYLQSDGHVISNTSKLIKPQIGSMESAIAAMGGTGAFKVLTQGDGKIDIVFTGAPECPHCQGFVKDGLDAFVNEAQERNLDVVYMPLAMSPIGHSLASIDACVVGENVATGAPRLKQIYAQEAILSTQVGELSKIPQEARRTAMLDIITSTASDLGSGEGALDFECYVGSAEAFRAESSLFGQVFEVEFTPSFFFEDPQTGLSGFSGHKDIDWMFGRLGSE